MIREGSLVRVNETKRLGRVWDFEEEVQGDRTDPSCVRKVRLFEPETPWADQPEEEHFLSELTEVVDALDQERKEVLDTFEFLRIDNFWADDCPAWAYVTIIAHRASSGSTEVWLQKGEYTDYRSLGRLNATRSRELVAELMGAGLHEWDHCYDDSPWAIGGNEWWIEAISGTKRFSTGGIDAYPPQLKQLCKRLRHYRLPVKFSKGSGLVYSPLKD